MEHTGKHLGSIRETSGRMWSHLAGMFETSEAIWKVPECRGAQEAPRRHPGGTQDEHRRHPGNTQRHPGDTQRHPRDTQEAPRGTESSRSHFEVKSNKSYVFYHQKWRERPFYVDGSDLILTKSAACHEKCVGPERERKTIKKRSGGISYWGNKNDKNTLMGHTIF